MKAYSEDLRRKIVQAVGGGMGKKARWREPWVSASLRSNVTSVWHTRGGLSLRRSLPACARRSMSKARGSSKRTSKSDRPLPSRNADSPRGQRARCFVPRNWGANITLLSSMSTGGMGPSLAVESSTTREVFEAYVEHVLAPSGQGR